MFECEVFLLWHLFFVRTTIAYTLTPTDTYTKVHVWAHAHTHKSIYAIISLRPPWISVRKFVCRNRRSYTVLTSSNSPIWIVITVCLFRLEYLTVQHKENHQNCRNQLEIIRIKKRKTKSLKLETLISQIKWTWK